MSNIMNIDSKDSVDPENVYEGKRNTKHVMKSKESFDYKDEQNLIDALNYEDK